ncbi:hypothetical protein KPB2_5522 [Klebsiella pneumoniae Kb677]|nr:hypothetical protein KPB2_5522 [Klebsiella pneumoniae Kb677]
MTPSPDTAPPLLVRQVSTLLAVVGRRPSLRGRAVTRPRLCGAAPALRLAAAAARLLAE